MRKLLFLCLLSTVTWAQRPAKPNAAIIYKKIERLNFLGTVLYLAAHPDDENTRLISYYANQTGARTGYLSLTRGDGGQNLIGPELRELLGVIRTQELIEARKIDGGEQFFSRANDFGYSKHPDETFRIWDKSQVLADVIWAIRKFQPDVIINRFDHRSPGTTHGHHTASAMLSIEAFDLAAKSEVYPEQLQYVSTWQPKRVFFNTSFWFYGGKDKFDKADKSHLWKIPVNNFDPLTGLSNAETAALSRSSHQSQGFGQTGVRGDEADYLEFIKGTPATQKTDIFEGIDTSWNRVQNGAEIGAMVSEVLKKYDFNNPTASTELLVKIWQKIQQLDDAHWKAVKSAEVADIIAAANGLYIEAAATVPDAVPGAEISIKLEATNRGKMPMELVSVRVNPGNIDQPAGVTLNPNVAHQQTFRYRIDANSKYSQPYWLHQPYTIGMYSVADQLLRGRPDVVRDINVIATIRVMGATIPYKREVIYKYNDEVKGEVYEPLDIVPEVTSSFTEPTYLFSSRRKSRRVTVSVRSGKADVSGTVKLELPEGWKVAPAQASFEIPVKGGESLVTFDVTAPKTYGDFTLKSIVEVSGKTHTYSRTDINYPHISKQMVLKPSQARLLNLDIRIGNEKVAYIMGAGDQVNNCLQQMGYDVTLVSPETLSAEKLAEFDVVMLGIRAYNTVAALAPKQQLLLDFVKGGKTMVVQYNTLDEFVTKQFSPYPLKISRDRVTDENAEVRFLAPNHPVLNYPNRITADDFKGWIQEQGLYYPSEWDAAFTPILSSNDAGEPAKNGALLVAPYGKGHYIYTGLSFFRELPEGVPGAYRLMANLISIKNR